MVAELLDPRFLLWGVPEGAQADPTVDVKELGTYLGREVQKVGVKVRDWSSRSPSWSENLWVADDYELTVDRATGVLLRVACRLNEDEFSVREVTRIAFDQPMNPAQFLPPDTPVG